MLVKKDGVWSWFRADSPMRLDVAKGLCECRVCRPEKPNNVCHICDGSLNELARASCSNAEIHTYDWVTHEDEELVYHAEEEE